MKEVNCSIDKDDRQSKYCIMNLAVVVVCDGEGDKLNAGHQ